MVNIYNCLKNVIQDLKKENNRIIVFVLLILLSIPLSYAVNSISIAVFFLIALTFFKKDNLRFQPVLLYPIVLYFLMVLSYIWSIDKSSTLSALSKELPLLMIPLGFIIFNGVTQKQKQKVLQFYGYGMLIFSVFYYLKAIFRYAITQDTAVFFYHELVTKDVNAIHVSVFVAIAFFCFFVKKEKAILDYISMCLLLIMVFLLSSKNIIAVFIGLILIYYLFLNKVSKKVRIRNLIIFILFLISLSFIGKIRDRFMIEYESNMAEGTVNETISKGDNKVYNVSVKQAWNNEKFRPNDFFPGTAFRVYQFRIFTEMIKENNVFFTGFGLSASKPKIVEKALQYNIFMGSDTEEGYQTNNFHNQYIQNFAELGFFGLLLLIIMLYINLRNAIVTKDFVHFAFAFLMISLFLTESFLWRQRGVVFFTIMYCLFNSNLNKTLAFMNIK